MADEADRAALKVYGILAVLGLGVIGGGRFLQYQSEPPLPPAPPVEKRPEARDMNAALTQSTDGYKALLAEDAKKFGAGISLATLAEPMPYKLEFEGNQRLVGKDGMQTQHLEIRARVEKQWT